MSVIPTDNKILLNNNFIENNFLGKIAVIEKPKLYTPERRELQKLQNNKTSDNEPRVPTNKICIIQVYDKNIKEYAELSRESIQKYCTKYNHDYICYNDFNQDLHYPVNWLKAEKILETLEQNYEVVLFLDSDIVITNYNKNITDYIKDTDNLIVCDDVGEWIINSGAIIVRNNDKAKNIIKQWDNNCKDIIKNNSKITVYTSGGDQNILIKNMY